MGGEPLNRRRELPNGEVAFALKGGWDEDVRADLAHGEFDCLEIWPGIWGDLEFLDEFRSEIRSVRSVGCDEGSLKGVERLSELESLSLSIDGPPKAKSLLDLGRFPRLKRLSCHWHRGYEEQLTNLVALESVGIEGYSGQDLSTFSQLKALKFLGLGRGELESLDGLENLASLEQLTLERLQKLTSIEALKCCSHLRELRIDNARNVVGLDVVAYNRSLEKLYLLNCGELDSLLWVKDLENLQLCWTAVPVGKLDWASIFGLPHLELLALFPVENDLISEPEANDLAQSSGKSVAEYIKARDNGRTLIKIKFEAQCR